MFPYGFLDNVSSTIQILGSGNSPSIRCNRVNHGSMLKALILVSTAINNLICNNTECKISACSILVVCIGLCNLDWSHNRAVLDRDQSIIEVFNFCSPASVCLLLDYLESNLPGIIVIVVGNTSFLNMVSARIQTNIGFRDTILTSGDVIHDSTCLKSFIGGACCIGDVLIRNNVKCKAFACLIPTCGVFLLNADNSSDTFITHGNGCSSILLFSGDFKINRICQLVSFWRNKFHQCIFSSWNLFIKLNKTIIICFESICSFCISSHPQ